MKLRQTHRMVRPVMLTVFLAGCGGSGHEQIAGIDGSGDEWPTQITGPVTAFGSVIVNGVRFDTSSAIIVGAAGEAVEGSLQVGDVVTVSGYVDGEGNARAERVFQRSGLLGRVEWLDAAENQLGLLGQTIQLEENTTLDESLLPDPLAALVPGDRVHISGYSGPGGVFVASRIELANTPSEVLSGPISELDTESGRFSVRGVAVHTDPTGLLPPLRLGQWVSVTGESRPNGFVAHEVALEIAYAEVDSTRMEVQGFLERDAETGALSISGITLQAGDALLEMVLQEDALAGRELRIRGDFDGQTLIAKDAVVLSDDDTQLKGYLESAELGEPVPYVVVDSIRFQISADTRLAGSNGQRVELNSLMVGDPVLIAGYETDDGWVATALQLGKGNWKSRSAQIKGEPSDVRTELKRFSLDGTDVVIESTTELLRANATLNEVEFFEQLSNHRVKAEGRLEGETLYATRIQLLPGRRAGK